jgi:hypothetical protein
MIETLDENHGEEPLSAADKETNGHQTLKTSISPPLFADEDHNPPTIPPEDPPKVLSTKLDDLYDTLERDIYPDGKASLEERIEDAPKHLLQFVAYVRLIDDRLRELESAMKKLKEKSSSPENKSNIYLDSVSDSAPDDEPIPEPPPEVSEPVGPILKIDRIPVNKFEEFRKRLPTRRCLIEVITSTPTPDECIPSETSTKQNSLQEVQTQNSEEPTPKKCEPVYATPERITIISTELVAALQEICGTAGSFSRSDDIDIMRPFKPLIVYEKEIRAKYAQLQEKCGVAIESNSNGVEAGSQLNRKTSSQSLNTAAGALKGSDSGEEKNQESSEIKKNEQDKTLMEQFKVLLELYDTDLKPIKDLEKLVDDGKVEQISFADLWHLFRPGTEIVNPNDLSQIYRVLNVTGGRPFLCTRDLVGYEADEQPDVEEEKKYGSSIFKGLESRNSFTIQCFSYDFDGKFVGAVENMIKIKQFDGVRAPSELSCCPISYLDDGPAIRERIIKRGRKFVEIVRSSEVVHKQYRGLSMDDPREEVREERPLPILKDMN